MKNIIQLLIIFFSSLTMLQSQAQVRYIFKNTSAVNDLSYPDNNIYVYTQLGMPGMNGYYNTNSGNWENINTAGNMTGPDGNTYTDANVRLSDMPTNANGQYYLDIPNGSSGRVYIGFGGPIYTVTANNPTLDSPSNPNYYTKVETIELTIGGQIFTNTSRVDRYAYPMGEELYCSNGTFYDKVGETVTHEQVIAKWKLFVNDEFQNSYDPVRDIITQMGHTPYFQEGNPGNDYFETFIDELFAYYRNNTLQAEWNNTLRTATVNGNIMTWNDGTTFDRSDFELENIIGAGAGSAFNNGIGQILGVCLNRGVVQLTTATQIWDEPNNFFQNPIKNDYTHFFHSDFVSFEGKTYALAYDDVFDQSSTQSCQGTPDSVVISLGGYGTEHIQTLTDVYIAPQNPEVDQYKTFQLNVKGLDQGLIDMDIPINAIVTWTVTDPNGNPATQLINDAGLFGPTNTLGDYTINVDVQTNGNTYSATTILKVVTAGTTGQTCRGDAQSNAEYKLEVIGQRVYLTLIPGSNWNNTPGYVRLFYGTNPDLGTMGANTLIPNQAYYMDGVFFGDQVYFYIFTEHNGGTQNGSPINIVSLGTCDGLEVEEAIINLETPQNTEIEITDTYQIPVTGLTNRGNSFDYPNSTFTKNIVFNGEGVDANGLFTPTTTGEFDIQITYDGIQITTTIKVINSACNNTLDLGPPQTVCEGTSIQLDLPAGTYSNIIWSGSGATFLDNTTSDSPEFTGPVGNHNITINATDGGGCNTSGTLDIKVNVKPNLSITYNSNEVCTYDNILTPTLSHGLGNISILPSNGSINNNGNFEPNNSPPNTYTIKYKYTDPTTTCEGDSSTFEITVNPRPITDISNNPTIICEGTTSIALQSSPTSGTFTGTGITDTILDITGLTDLGNPFTIIYNYQDPISNCEALEASFNYSVISTPTPTFTNASELSNNVLDQNSVPEICANGTFIQWYATLDTSTTSIATTDCYSPIFLDLTPTDNKMDIGVYTYFATQTINGCQSKPQEISLTISDCPLQAPEVFNYHSCIGNSPVLVTANSNGGNIGWFLNQPTNPILGDEDFTENTWDQHGLTNEGVHMLYVAEYDNTNNCYGPLASVTIEVHNTPIITTPNLDTICSSSPSPILLNFTPSNATLSGNGVVNNTQWQPQFDPLVTEITNTTLNLLATEDHGSGNDIPVACISNTSFDIAVVHATLPETANNSALSNSINNQSTVPKLCATGTAIQWYQNNDTTTTPIATTDCYTTSFIDNSPTDGNMDAGNYTFYATQSLNGCKSNVQEVTLTISDCPVLAPETTNHHTCLGNDPINVTTLSNKENIGWFHTLISNPKLGNEDFMGKDWNQHNLTTEGTYTVYAAEFDNANTCYGPLSAVTIEIHALPEIILPVIDTLCSSGSSPLDITFIPSNATLSGVGVINSNQWELQFDSSTTGITTTTLLLEATENHGNVNQEIAQCTSDTSFEVAVRHVTAPSGTGIEQAITHGLNQLTNLPDMVIDFNASSTAQLFIKDASSQIINTNNASTIALYPSHISTIGTYNYEVYQELQGCSSDIKISTWEIIKCSTEAPDVTDTTLCFGERLPILAPTSSGTNFEWTSNDGVSLGTNTTLDLNQFGNTYSNVGDHIIYVSKEDMDASNQLCRGPKKEVKITLNPIPTIQIDNEQTCNGETLLLSPTYSNSTNAQYTWRNLNQIIGDTKTLTITPSETTEYSIQVENNFNCINKTILTIDVVEQAIAEINSTDFILCNDEALALTAFNNNSESYTFNWLFGNSKNNLNTINTTESISINKKGFYALKVTNKDKCITLSDTQEVTLESFEFYAEASEYNVSENEKVNLYTTVTEGIGSIEWITPNGIEKGAEIEYIVNEDTRFYVSIQGLKCVDTSSVFVKVNKPFLIPNGFSPNGDGKNETWNISGLPSVSINISIYNRWGSLVYEYPSAYTEPWKGTNQAGENLPLDTYYYVIRSNDDSLNLTGTITILK